MMTAMELLLGCGSRREKHLGLSGPEWTELVTLDNNPDHKPDVLWDLYEMPYPFDDEQFSEIHAYEVLEHIGTPGDWKFFFDQFAEIWRLLEMGGFFYATVPVWNSVWAWGDPSHTRTIQQEQLVFLSQRQYEEQVGVTPMSDFRFYWKKNFETVFAKNLTETMFAFALQKYPEHE